MASERVQRVIDRLPNEAEQAVSRYDWNSVRQAADTVLDIDPDNSDVITFLVRAPLEVWESHRVAEHALKALGESPKHSSLADERDELRTALLERGYFRARDVP